MEQIFAPPYLTGFNIDIYEGEITGLIGIDYLGMDMLLGLIQHNLPLYYGRVFYCGKKVNASDFASRGQNNAVILDKRSLLIDSLSVSENLFIIRDGHGRNIINRRALFRQTQNVLAELHVESRPDALVSSLSPCDKWILELAKAWISGASLVVIRDISNCLAGTELLKFTDAMKYLAGKKMGFLYICNHHQEVFRFCSRCFLMKQGRVIKILEKDQMTDEIMTCYSYDFEDGLRRERIEQPSLRKEHLQREGFYCHFEGLSFTAMHGECIVLLDSDSRIITPLFERLSGTRRFPCSDLRLDGKPWKPGSPDYALISAHPASELVFPQLSVIDNICFRLDHKVPGVWFDDRHKKAVARDLYSSMGDAVYARSAGELDERAKYDIVYQRILLQHPSFICAVQPFASVDMMTRLHLLSYYEKFREKGITVCILAFALSDSLEIADRLLVIRNGRIEKELTRAMFFQYDGISGSRPRKT